MDKFRYISPIESSAMEQMAIDEAILRTFDQGDTLPTLRFYRFKPSAISIGYSQDIDKVIDLEKCNELGIPFVRRITGGGTVYHDYSGEITYSIVVEQDQKDIQESFRHLLQPLINVLNDFGLNAKFKPYNDILLSGKKVSGSAQKRGKKGLLQHGTLMFATDLETLSKILLIDKNKFKNKKVDSFLDLVTTVEKELDEKIDPSDLINSMKKSYENYLEYEFIEDNINNDEKRLLKRLILKYQSEEWNLNRCWKGDKWE